MARNKIKYRNTIYDRLSSGGVHLAMSFLSDALEANTLSVAVETENKEILDFLLDDPVTYYYRKKQIGIFYLQSVQQITENKYELYATSAIGLLMKRIHRGGIYTGQTVKEILPDIFGPIPYSVKSNLLDIKLYGWLPYVEPPDSSARDNLVQILFAIGASVKTDLNGTVRIEPLWDGVSSFEGTDRMGQGASVTRDAKVTSVSVTEHQYTVGTESADLFEGTVQEGDIITFDEPMHSLEATGFSILSSGANYATLSAGSGKLTGKNYIHNTRIIEKKISESQTENIESVEDKTLVSLVNSNAAAERLANYHKCFEFIDAKIVYKDEMPGDVINVYHPYDKKIVTVCLESADINLSNTLKADETLLVGFVPPKASAEYYDTMELIDEDTTWTVPDGVTSLRVVLIGGGSGGSGGAPGEDGGRGIFGTKGRGKGGSGGVKGEAGAGGKIYQNNITVSPGNAFQVHIGNGGTGGNGGEAPTNGSDGGDTTFGELSSLNGSRSENGFYEQTSGITYAKPGEAGIPGGNGDGANSTAENVIYKGVTYTPGDTVRGETYEGYVASGGGGGGASAGENGKDGTIGRVSTQPYATGGDGGDGGTPVSGENATIYGFGGSGGHGGGGGGGGGNCTGAEDRYTWEGAGGSGGIGSKGGNGYQGCVILYYSAPKLTASGPVMDRTGRFILDKLGRRFVV